MQFQDLLHEREADPGAFVGASGRALHAVKSLEQSGNLVRRHADAAIGDLQHGKSVAGGHANRNRTAQRKFKGIGDQVEHDLFPHALVYV